MKVRKYPTISRGSEPMSRHRHQEAVLRSLLDELANAEPNLQALFDRKHEGPQGRGGDGHLRQQRQLQDEAAQLTTWTAGPLRGKLRELSALQVSDEGPSPGATAAVSAAFAVAAAPGLVYAAVDALVRLINRLLLVVDPAAGGEARATPLSPKRQEAGAQQPQSLTLARSLVDLALLCLGNLLESPCWRHVFFRVLHEVQLEHQRHKQYSRRGSGGGGASSGKPSTVNTTLQEYLWRKIVAEASPVGGAAKSETKPPSPPRPTSTPSQPAPVVDHAAVRLCCSMVRHCPLSFSASSYASLAPHLADYLLDGGGGGGNTGGYTSGSGGDDNEKNGLNPQTDLMVVLDLFSACTRGSPHFRQYVKGLRRKRELFRRLLGFLGPQCDGRIVVRALCALTRVLAGDPLEAKVFDRGNALETASLVMDSLLDVSSSASSERTGYAHSSLLEYSCGGSGGALGEQRRYADVASDLARSRVFTSVLVDSGRLESFLRKAVMVLARAAADVLGCLSTDVAAAGATQRGAPQQEQQRRQASRPEPLLRALCSFCLEHSPARSAFIQALLDRSSSSGSSGGVARTGAGGASGDRPSTTAAPSAARTVAVVAADPCAALFMLCLHPHPPSAAAASTLLQCLLVGGGALGAVSGPSTGAAAGVGVIPASFLLPPIGGGRGDDGRVRAAGIGREDPLQQSLLERIGAVALGVADGRKQQTPITGNNGVGGVRHTSGGGGGGTRGDGDESSNSEADDSDTNNGNELWYGCGSGDSEEKPAGPVDATTFPERSSSTSSVAWPGALNLVVLRLRQIGGDLGAAQAQQQLGLEGSDSLPWAPRAAREGGAWGLNARAVETELELTSVLCLLSSLALAVPATGRALAHALPLEAAFAPVLAAQRSVLSGIDPADYPRAPVEIVLISLTLIAQLGVALSGDGGGGGWNVRSGDSSDVSAISEAEEEEGQRRRARQQRRRGRHDAARAARLRRFLGEQAAAGEVKLCLGHAACRAESKDLARRAAALISLLQAGGGADALLVADSLYAFAQAAETREAGLRSRAVAAENAVYQERAAGARRAAALEEAEGLVAQIEARNAEDLRRLSDQESAARRRAEEAHARALTRGEVSLRRAEENVVDLEAVLRSKEEALGCVERELRVKDLEIAALRGDLAGEQRLRSAVTVKLEEASVQRDELSRGKAEAESFLESLKDELSKVREEALVSSKGWEDEGANAARGWASARKAMEELERSNGRAEDAYGKLILLARGYKSLEEDSRCKVVDAERLLMEAEAKAKLFQEQAREEERRHRSTKAALKDGEASLLRAEQRLAKVSGEAAEAQAAAAAARAAGRELKEKAESAAREAKLKREEVARLKAEVERSRAACAEKDLELVSKSKELGQQAGIIDYINKLSSSAAAEAATAAAAAAAGSERLSSTVVPSQAVVVVQSRSGGGKAIQVPNSEGY